MDELQTRLLTEILSEVQNMADLRNLILASQEENKVLVAALGEAQQLIQSLRQQNAGLITELENLRNDTTSQAEIDAITAEMEARKNQIERWIIAQRAGVVANAAKSPEDAARVPEFRVIGVSAQSAGDNARSIYPLGASVVP